MGNVVCFTIGSGKVAMKDDHNLAAEPAEPVAVRIKGRWPTSASQMKTQTLSVPRNADVSQLKQITSTATGVPVEQMRLLCMMGKGTGLRLKKELHDGKRLQEYNIEETLKLMWLGRQSIRIRVPHAVAAASEVPTDASPATPPPRLSLGVPPAHSLRESSRGASDGGAFLKAIEADGDGVVALGSDSERAVREPQPSTRRYRFNSIVTRHSDGPRAQYDAMRARSCSLECTGTWLEPVLAQFSVTP